MHFGIRLSSFRLGCATWIGILTVAFPAAFAEPPHVQSPDGRWTVAFRVGENGQPLYDVEWSGRRVIRPSRMGFATRSGPDLSDGFERCRAEGATIVDTSWQPVWGERAEIRDHYRTTIVHFEGSEPSRRLSIEVRAYDEGVGWRYRLPESLGSAPLRLEEELTEFRFTGDHPTWAVTSAQGEYRRVPIGQVEHAIERPCVLAPASGPVLAIAEAAQIDFPQMRLRRSKTADHTLTAALHSGAVCELPAQSPWRVIMAANDAGTLLEQNYLLLNLNEPCALEDTSWIRPGKVIREVTLSTEGGKACVDFAVNYGLQFIEYDAGWYGNERDENADARTVARPNLDLHEVIRYARERDIGVIVYVNRRHLERQLDDLLPLYQSWGLAGIKFGFVQHGSQNWTRWMHDAIRKCAEHHLMVDVHDEYRMTGWQRTYPNFMTAEGIGGDETRPTNEQVLANLFTRMIAAPADHTFCYYNGYVDEKTSHAAQLAKPVLFYSPWQFLFWYDQPRAADDEPELDFWRHMPTTWDETRVLHGKIGTYGVIARRAGDAWFIGGLNTGQPRTLSMEFSFLPAGRPHVATLYEDAPTVPTRTHVAVRQIDVDSRSTLQASMSAHGGIAIRIVPADTHRAENSDGPARNR